MTFKPWDCAQPDEWLPRSLRLCWGSSSGDSSSSGSGWGDSGASTGPGDWGSSGTYDASSYNATGDVNAWAGTAYDASTFGTGAGAAGDWSSFGPTNYSGMNAPDPIFTDIAGPNPGVTTGAGDWGSAGTYSAAGMGGGPGGSLFGSTGAGAGFYGGGPGGLFGDYGSGGSSYSGGGGGGGGRGGNSAFGSFSTLGASNTGRGSERSASEPAFADTAGSAGGRVAADAPAARSDAPTRGEAEVSSVPQADQDAPEAGPSFGEPTTSEPSQDDAAPSQSRADTSPSLTDAAPAGWIGGQPDTAAPATQSSAFGPQTLDEGPPSQAYTDATQALSGLTQTALSGADYQGSPYADMGREAAAPNFDQAFGSFATQPGWNPAEQTAGRTGLAEPTDWAGSPYAPSTDVSIGRDFNQAFESFDTPTGMDLAGDQRSETEPALTFNEMWGATPYNTLPNDPLSRSAQETLLSDFSFFPNPGYVQGPPAPTLNDRINDALNSALNMAVPDPFAGVANPLTAWSQFAQNTLLGGPNIQSLNPDAIAAQELGEQGRAGQNYIMDTPFVSPTVPTQVTEVELTPSPDVITPGQLQNVQHPAAEVPPSEAPPGEQAPPGAETAPSRPGETPSSRPAEQPQALPLQPTETPQAPPGLVDMLPPGALTPQVRPAEVPQVQPQEQPAEPDDDHDAPEPGDRSQPPQDPNAPRPPANIPGQLLGSRGQYDNPHADTPQTSRTYRDRPGTAYTQGRPGITFRTARQAGIQPLFSTEDINTGDTDARLIENINRALRDMERQTGIPANSLVATSGWRAAWREEALEHGMDARTSQASVRSRSNPVRGRHFPAAEPGHSNHGPGRALDFADSRARAWLRQHAREYGLETLGGTFDMPHIQLQRGQGGERPSEQEQAEQRAIDAQNRQAAIDRGLIGGGRTQVAGVPLPRGRPGDAPQPDVAQPPADIPPQQPETAARPPPEAPQQPAPRPPADIPSLVPPRATGPNEFDIPTTPARAGHLDPVTMARTIAAIQKEALRGINPNTTKEQAMAQGAKGRAALIAAGIPPAMARAAMLDTGAKTAVLMGYGPGGKNSTVLGFPIPQSTIQGKITEGVGEAMQGYHPAAPGPVQGPPAPAQQRSDVPFGGFVQLAAGGRDVGAPPVIDRSQIFGPPGRAEGQAPLPGGLGANIDPSDVLGPRDPRSETIYDPDRGVGRTPVIDPDLLDRQQQERELQQQNLDPRGWQQASLLNFLQNFNPISTAEARGGRSQAGQLTAPRADPGVIQGRLAAARADIVNELQTNQGLRNTLDLIVTGEVGSQGKAAVLGFLETAMNKVAAEASRQGREATGRDLLNYLNNRSYFPDTWGKIESGKVRGGALTDDLIGAIGAGSNTTQLSTGNSSASSQGSRFGGNPTNVTIGREHYGVENYGHHAAWYNAMGALPSGRGIGSDYAAGPYDATAVGAMPAPDIPMRGLAKGGRVDDDEPVVVGEQGPEVFVPDRPGTVWPHIPQPGKPGNIDRWPRVPNVEQPGLYGGVEREIRRRTRAAQDVVPSLVDMIDSGRLRLNAANWRAMMNDPALIALGRSRMDDRREGIDPGAEQYGAFIPAPAPAAEPPDPTSQMAQALGYGSIRRPMRIGRQSYSQ